MDESKFLLNYFPNDEEKHIDYVIYYKTTPKTTEEAKKMREKFKKQLEEKESIEIYELKIQKQQKDAESTYLLLNCPLNRLMIEAERLHLYVPLKEVYDFLQFYFMLNIFILVRLDSTS